MFSARKRTVGLIVAWIFAWLVPVIISNAVKTEPNRSARREVGNIMTIAEMRTKAGELPERQGRFAELLLKYATFSPFATASEEDTPTLMETLEWRDGLAINDMFQPGSDAYLAVEALTGPENAGLARMMWERSGDLPYTTGFELFTGMVRSFRGGNMGSLYLHDNLTVLRTLVVSLADGFTLESYLEGYEKPLVATDQAEATQIANRKNRAGVFVPRLLGMRLDDDAALLERVRAIFESRMQALYQPGYIWHGVFSDPASEQDYLRP